MEIKMTALTDTIKLLDISDEEYFGSGYKNYISNSRLKLMNPDQGGSPQLYKEGLGASVTTESLIRGSAVHCIVLQPNDFVIAPLTTRPTAKLGMVADVLYPKFKESWSVSFDDIVAASNKIDYYKGKITEERASEIISKCQPYWEGRADWETRSQDSREPIFLDGKSWDIVNSCINSVGKHSEIQQLLHPKGITEDPIVLNEGTLLMDVKASVDGQEIILKLKAKLDSLTIDLENNTLILNDLKTTGHILADFGTGSYVNFHYSRQMAMYLWMLKLYAEKAYGMQNPKMYANMMLVSTIPDYRAGIYRCKNQEIAEGFKEFKKLLRMVAYCEVYGYDGGLGTDIDGSAFDFQSILYVRMH